MTKPNVDIICPLCNNDVDDLRHFLFLCSSLNCIRSDEYHKLQNRLLRQDLQCFWYLFISGNLNVKMSLMLGVSDIINNVPLQSSFDVFCKSYLKRAWTSRTAMIDYVWLDSIITKYYVYKYVCILFILLVYILYHYCTFVNAPSGRRVPLFRKRMFK